MHVMFSGWGNIFISSGHYFYHELIFSTSENGDFLLAFVDFGVLAVDASVMCLGVACAEGSVSCNHEPRYVRNALQGLALDMREAGTTPSQLRNLGRGSLDNFGVPPSQTLSSYIYSFIFFFYFLFIYSFMYLFIHLFIYIFSIFYLSIHSCICLFICLFIYLFV
jgi:hypothetical protein